MADPITITDLAQAGRLAAPDPNLPRVFYTYNADFTTDADVTLDLTIINQGQTFGVVRALFIDNGSNPSEVEVAVSNTDQYFTIPPYAQGVFKIDAQPMSRINFKTDGGATDKVTITVYNWEVSPSVWYRFGAFNKDVPLKVQGAQPSGTDMDNPTENNNPVFAAGSDLNGVLRPLRTDATGRLEIIGSGAGGQVYGPDADGAPPTQPPVLMAGADGANVQTLLTDGAGRLQIIVASGLTGLATEATLLDVETAIGLTNTKLDTIIENTDKGVTATRSTVAGAAANTLILASNAARQGATVFNDSTAILYLALGTVAASFTSYTVQIAAGGYYEVPAKYSGEIRGIWDSATGNARVTEIA